MTIAAFRKIIMAHYRRTGRHGLAWRHTRDPYAILVSEIMLQQTQVGRVEGYYERFLERFPHFRALARASQRDVLKAWQGLGYNRRALFLKRTAEIVMAKHGGKLPRDRAALEELPGIGKGTSGSLMAFAFNEPVVFIETNIRRVFIHFFFEKRQEVTDGELERYIERSVDKKNPREWYWALMDYGAMMGGADAPSAPSDNPNRRSAHYKKQSAFSGSDRQLRGRLLRTLLLKKNGRMPASAVRGRMAAIVRGLEKEGFVVKRGDYLCIKN